MSFFAFLAILFLIFFVLRPLLRVVIAVNRRRKAFRDFFNQATGQAQHKKRGNFTNPFGFSKSSANEASPRAGRRKIFSPDEGEYVDFEEIDIEASSTVDPDGNVHTSYSHTETRYTGPAEPRIVDAEWEDLPDK